MNSELRSILAASVLGILLALAIPSFAQEASPAPAGMLKIGSKAFTESVILGEILCELARTNGVPAEHLRELGGTQIAWEGLNHGKLDAYPEYTGTLIKEIFGSESPKDDGDLRAALMARGLLMTGRLGFNNSYALGMREADAEKLGIKTISDLVNHPQLKELKIGLSDEFKERPDGWKGLRTHYKVPELHLRGIDHALAFRAIGSNGLDLMDLWTTDPEIALYKLRVLEDDKRYFPQYDAVILYRPELITRAPKVAAAFERLGSKIDAPKMIQLNHQAKNESRPESQVAAAFVRELSATNTLVAAAAEGKSSAQMLAEFWGHTQEHLFLVLISLGLAILVAVPLGVLAYRFEKFGQGLLAVVGIIQTIPAMAVLVFMIPLLGLGAWPAIVALFLYSLLPIVRGTHTGLTEIAPQIHESAEVLGLPSGARLWLVELPLASPSILSGIKTAAVINVGTATIGALIGAGGYGQPILSGIRLNDIGLILQGAVPAALLAVVVQLGFEFSERWLVPAGLRVAKE